jgi:hypothetical protein
MGITTNRKLKQPNNLVFPYPLPSILVRIIIIIIITSFLLSFSEIGGGENTLVCRKFLPQIKIYTPYTRKHSMLMHA